MFSMHDYSMMFLGAVVGVFATLALVNVILEYIGRKGV